MRSAPSSGTRATHTICPVLFDAWFSARAGELTLLRRVLGDWLSNDCSLDAELSGEIVMAAHEAGAELLEQMSPRSSEQEGFACRGEYDGATVTVTLVAAEDVCAPPLQDPRRLTTQLVLHLVDQAEVEVRDGSAQVSLRRDTAPASVHARLDPA
jgi:hypothetical protein